MTTTSNLDQSFNPIVHHVDQYDAVMVCRELSEPRVTLNGAIEQYSGIHPTYGKCIVVISNSSDGVIIPIS